MKSSKSLHSYRSRMLNSEHRVPLNAIVLPPLPQLDLHKTEVKIFHNLLLGKPNGSRVTSEILSVERSAEILGLQNELSKDKDAARILQLEHNVRFLQEQHTQMLTGLHKEIDNLRHKNRELQFQLVFAKGGIPSSPSSPEDDTTPKINYSPKQVNVTPLQVELLEKELGELKLKLNEVDSTNIYLSAIVDEQKKKTGAL